MRHALRLAAFGFLAIGAAPSPSMGQGIGDISKLNVADVTAPSSPAFTILGIAPTSIQKPADSRAISTSLLALTHDKSFPSNLAVEVTPYWLKSRPSLTFDQLYRSSIGSTFLRTSAFSVGSTPRLQGKDTIGTGFALGYRAMLWSGRQSDVLKGVKDRLIAGLGACAAASDVDACYAKLKPLIDSVKSNMEPVGFRFQLATAASAQFPRDSFALGHVKTVGLWATPSYTLEQHVDFIAVARYLRIRSDTTGIAATKAADVGLRLLWKPTAAFGLSAEGLARHLDAPDGTATWTRRFGAVIELQASDDWYITYALGKDFAASTVSRSPLFASLGLNLGFGNKPTVKVQ
ncbi:MAG TPA: hypothetical protein VHB25_11735 [Gemmatimonadaceae bacterium]|nr:hypothetical protein [Gemmatimonadaceae bacterium]